jgi:general secretion pathway protein G
MDVKDLKYFVAVYESKGFCRASRTLGTVQSNVSARIRTLERFLGVPLFQRGHRRISPTEDADILYEQAKKLLAAVDQTIHTLRLSRAAQHQARTNGMPRGFTLLELLVVVVIIGLLSSFVAPRYFSQVGRSEVQVAKAQIDALEKALDQYRLDSRRYPTSEQGLKALVERPVSEPRWNGPYMKRGVPLDPWGRPYYYRASATPLDYELGSYGRDGRPGGIGEDADLSNQAPR